MNNTKKYIISLLLLFFGMTLQAQSTENMQIKGKVIDAFTKSPVEGVVVNVKGLSLSVSTDENGDFTLEVPSLSARINVWGAGYQDDEVAILNRTYLPISITPETRLGSASEFQLPFNGNLDISEKTSLINVVSSEERTLSTTSVEQMMMKIPGLQVTNMSGMPGEGSFLQIRGLKTMEANTQPLIVLNGIPMLYSDNESYVIDGYTKGILSMLNPQDVKNITFHKGAESAVYGSRASNGVIMIETESATAFDTRVEFNGNYGFATFDYDLPVLGVSGYKKLVNDVGLTSGMTLDQFLDDFHFLIDDPDYYYNYLYNSDTNWQKQINRTGFVTDNTLRVQGGDEIGRYDFAFGYQNFQGTLKGTSLERYYTRINSEVELSNKLRLNAGIATGYATKNLMEQGMVSSAAPIMAALRKNPLISPYAKDNQNNLTPNFSSVRDDQGNLLPYDQISNPLALVDLVEAKVKSYDVDVNAAVTYQWNQYFNLKGTFGIYYNTDRENVFIPGKSETFIAPLTYTDSNVADNTVRAAVTETYNLYGGFFATYARTFDYVHDFRGSLGAQMTMNRNELDAASGKNTSSDWLNTLGQTEGTGRKFFGFNEKWNWINMNANLRYTYNSTVGVNVALAYDGSSSVGEDANRLAFYPSANVSLYAKNLEFLKDASWLDRLNVLFDYTTTGNSQFDSSMSKKTYTSKRYRDFSSILREGIPNSKLKPEITKTLNFGVETSLLNNRLGVSLTLYQSKTHDLILPQALSPVYGYSTYYKNAGKLENKGIELAFQGTILQNRDLIWNVGATYTRNKNKVLSLGGQESLVYELADGSALITKVGGSLYEFYGYQADGVITNTLEAEALALTNPGGAAFGAGDIRWVDTNRDNVIGEDDRVSLGSAAPKYFGAIFTNFRYKNLGVSATLNYSYGNKAYNAVRRDLESMSDYSNQLNSVASRWSYEGQVTDMPKAQYGDPMDNNRFSSRFVEDASYLKLKELVVSYDFNYFNGITVYVAGENLFTVTNYLGYDPEFAYSYNAAYQGFDYAKVPLARTFKFGVRIQF